MICLTNVPGVKQIMCFDEFQDICRLGWTKASTIITTNSKVTSHIKKRRLYQKIIKSVTHSLESKSTNADATHYSQTAYQIQRQVLSI